MESITVTCPKCGSAFPLDETLAGPAIARVRADAQTQLDAERLRAKNLEAKLTAEFDLKLKTERSAIEQDALQKAQTDVALQITAAKDEAESYRKKLVDAEAEQLKLERDKHDFEAAKSRFELEKQKAINEAAAAARKETEESVKSDFDQKLKESEIETRRLRSQIDELKRKADQKSTPELQGEALEAALEEQLAEAFKLDLFEPVKRGQRGADLGQLVNGAIGTGDGTILWEFKRAQNWSNDWAARAKENARETGACAIVIVTDALPKGVKALGQYDSVWVCEPRFAIGLARALRAGIVEVSRTRLAVAGRESRAEALWDYVTGADFRSRVQHGMEAYSALVKLHEQDKKRTTLRWRSVEKANANILDSLCGIAGDIQVLRGERGGALIEDEDDLAELPPATQAIAAAIQVAESDQNEADAHNGFSSALLAELFDEDDD